ncbi:unnamed protein product, partial [Closterium sp. Naga37s-1]
RWSISSLSPCMPSLPTFSTPRLPPSSHPPTHPLTLPDPHYPLLSLRVVDPWVVEWRVWN